MGVWEGSNVSLRYCCVREASPSSSSWTHSGLACSRSSWKLVLSHIALSVGRRSFNTSCPHRLTLTYKTLTRQEKKLAVTECFLCNNWGPIIFHWAQLIHAYAFRWQEFSSPWHQVPNQKLCQFCDRGDQHLCISDRQSMHSSHTPPKPDQAPLKKEPPSLKKRNEERHEEISKAMFPSKLKIESIG